MRSACRAAVIRSDTRCRSVPTTFTLPVTFVTTRWIHVGTNWHESCSCWSPAARKKVAQLPLQQLHRSTRCMRVRRIFFVVPGSVPGSRPSHHVGFGLVPFCFSLWSPAAARWERQGPNGKQQIAAWTGLFLNPKAWHGMLAGHGANKHLSANL